MYFVTYDDLCKCGIDKKCNSKIMLFYHCLVTYQCLGCTTEMYLSMVAETVDRMEPLREIWGWWTLLT